METVRVTVNGKACVIRFRMNAGVCSWTLARVGGGVLCNECSSYADKRKHLSDSSLQYISNMCLIREMAAVTYAPF